MEKSFICKGHDIVRPSPSVLCFQAAKADGYPRIFVWLRPVYILRLNSKAVRSVWGWELGVEFRVIILPL